MHSSRAPKSRVLKLLLVEDVDEMQVFLKTILEENGKGEAGPDLHVTDVAGNGAEARRAREKRRPDGVLLDEVLPGEASLDLLPELLADGIPVILLTGMEQPSHGVPHGVKGRLIKLSSQAKPTERQAFRDAIRKAILTDTPEDC